MSQLFRSLLYEKGGRGLPLEILPFQIPPLQISPRQLFHLVTWEFPDCTKFTTTYLSDTTHVSSCAVFFLYAGDSRVLKLNSWRDEIQSLQTPPLQIMPLQIREPKVAGESPRMEPKPLLSAVPRLFRRKKHNVTESPTVRTRTTVHIVHCTRCLDHLGTWTSQAETTFEQKLPEGS